MQGTQKEDFKQFQPEFKDLTDYIVKITHEIWEERNVDRIRDYYGKEMKLHTANGVIVGAEGVVFNTLQVLNTFPDRRLLPEDVVWCRSSDGSYYSSHRIISTATHLGGTLYGAPSGRPILIRTVADCAVRDKVIFEEWLVRDQAGMLLQMGKPLDEFVAKAAEADMANGRANVHCELAEAVKAGKFPDFPGEYSRKYAESLSEIWSKGRLGVIPNLYHEGCRMEGPLNRTAYGHEMLNRFYFLYLSTLNEVKFSVDHLIELREPEMPVRVSMRWRLSGIHAANGVFGPATRKPIYILGINQAHISDGKVIAEWMMIDEFSILRQAHLNRQLSAN